MCKIFSQRATRYGNRMVNLILKYFYLRYKLLIKIIRIFTPILITAGKICEFNWRMNKVVTCHVSRLAYGLHLRLQTGTQVGDRTVFVDIRCRFKFKTIQNYTETAMKEFEKEKNRCITA